MPFNAPLDWKDIKNSAAKFSIRFKNAKKEDSYKQTFWNEFFAMFGIDTIEVGMYEQFVKKFNDHSGEIDYFWPGTLIIEHKSAGKDLDKAHNQALEYIAGLENHKLWPQFIIVSDFKHIRVYDVVSGRSETILLSELADNIEKFRFLRGEKPITGQDPVNIKAAELMGELYDMLKDSNYPKEDLDTLLIRLVFCLFAENADIFDRDIFSSYLEFHTGEDGSGMAGALTEIFSVLNTPLESRQTAMSSELKNFPYVNGGLFAKQILAPSFDREMRQKLLQAARLDWKYISPAIFGSLFQCIMDPDLRRELGAHYTSEENILKLINPLFMDELRHEFVVAKGNKKALRRLWDKMSNIRIFDPACGCGNFLIISYRELRLLEMDLLKELYGSQMVLDESHLYVDHFYGIELEDFPSMVANLSIILMDHLMNVEMRNRFGQSRDIIPLKEKANIICANSLRTDWKELIDPSMLTYIVGNPPFVGHQNRDEKQIEDMHLIFGDVDKAGKLDYVTAWYKKAAEYMTGTEIKAAFVSTNSICQGESVGILWEDLNNKGIVINFGYRTFVWSNEAKNNAAVHCVIVGFSYLRYSNKIFDGDTVFVANNINGYLIDGPDVYVHSRSPSVHNLPKIIKGSQPTDGGYLFLTEEQRKQMIDKYPQSETYIRRFIGAEEFINGELRYCLWLVDVNPELYRNIPEIRERLEKISEKRRKSPTKSVQKDADRPYLFTQIRQPDCDYLVIPRHSSGQRKYVPFGFIDKDVIAGDAVSIIPTDDLFVFGIISSHLHMLWLDTVGGKLKSDYRYQPFVYNSFSIPKMSEEMKDNIRKAAKNVLDVRSSYPESTLEVLYDPMTMPYDLLKAHQSLDREVDKAYNPKGFKNDNDRLKVLFELYRDLMVSQ